MFISCLVCGNPYKRLNIYRKRGCRFDINAQPLEIYRVSHGSNSNFIIMGERSDNTLGPNGLSSERTQNPEFVYVPLPKQPARNIANRAACFEPLEIAGLN